jgi:hypothetical protein
MTDPPKTLEAMFDRSADQLEDVASSVTEKVENFGAWVATQLRPTDPIEQTQFDIGVGVGKGTYGFAKDLIAGTWGLLRSVGHLLDGNPETWKNTHEAVKDIAQFVVQAQGYAAMLEYGSPEDQEWAREQMAKEPHPVLDAMAQHFETQWDDAVKNGTQVQLASEWLTRSLLELAAIVIPFTKAKLVAEAAGAKIPQAESVLSKGHVACEVCESPVAAAKPTISERAPGTKAPKLAPSETAHEEKLRREEEKQRRIEEIRQERAENDAKIKELDKKFQPANERARQAGIAATEARNQEREDLFEKARRNADTARRLQGELGKLRYRNRELNAEELRLRRPEPTTWQEAEQALREQFGGQKIKIETEDGVREIDCLTPDLVAREAKFGPQGDSTHIQWEIKKDVLLLESGQVKRVEWHFYRNEKTGIGPSGPLLKRLKDAGIEIVMHY